jgi:hypothetical protein
MGQPISPRGTSTVLVLAGVYNLAWGAWVILMPELSFSYSGMEQADKPLHYPQLWQCIGMIVGVYGVAYVLAARDPVRHWPVVLVGFLGKSLGPIGLAVNVATGRMPADGLLTCIPNDLIWWAPFLLILRHAYRMTHGRS